MIIEKGTSVGDKSFATDRVITDAVAVCLYHNQTYVWDLQQALPFVRNVDFGGFLSGISPYFVLIQISKKIMEKLFLTILFPCVRHNIME